jgi:GAF domain-containing protein
MTKQQKYDRLFQTLDSLCEGETDHVALMATMACELYHVFEHFSWVGFYRNVGGQILKIGPYQGTHGCLTIPFSQGVCGKCAREGAVQNVPDVSKVEYHIACSATTKSELVVPIFSADDELVAVLDVDSDLAAAFDETDEISLQRLSRYFLGSGG